ncbi:LEAF RUST 10 DISEASE-RESISTANCE LOCUS RECEPTOR-LIKE PROTEIN KINASE-like 1.1 [Abrus precatorius]|uniref:LEAF RUST 10 DISEASE-RESISTANCE LOCUS RECEPTOR-LIKE PROTEIN KINASE-like 1.1 n=1 Tax=Abrus precatorius TaxID=3816 RepID=A0A8B8M8C9_ABRPR|nr:LEAF RUST 10 DISEASE-RESISTANCE LOCUS RECEPTOR-LIKE PROTEIN KINASE-like 1.1 [Abrus precatorius]
MKPKLVSDLCWIDKLEFFGQRFEFLTRQPSQFRFTEKITGCCFFQVNWRIKRFKMIMVYLGVESLTLLLVVLARDGKCPAFFNCGFLGQIKFPFTDTHNLHCGVLAIRGCDEHNPYAIKTIQLNNSTSTLFNVLQVAPRTITIRDEQQQNYLQNKSCQAFTNKITGILPHTSPLASFYIKYNITIFRCNHFHSVTPPKFYKYSNCSQYDIYYGPPNIGNLLDFKWPKSLAPCSKNQLPIMDNPAAADPFKFLTHIISIEIKLSEDCEKCLGHRRGQCQLDSKGKFYCAKGIGIGLPGIIITALLIIWRYKRKCVHFYSNPNAESAASVYLGVPIFTDNDLEVATKNFDQSREVGKGGFGVVYYGKLHDGREVAVKRLHEHNYRRVEQFMNEIKILTRLRHKNLVSLYGCTSRHSRELLLVYEYISNGTVASHLRHESTNPGFLGWPIRMKVAIETATALAYLHASDIIHRDVKTNNILLDNTFCVKVADFGLSRVFPSDVTHVSTAPQGTPGYVDPEYHRCYQLTSKSDVYSFGVVLIELISSMPAVDMTRHKDEINLADLAIRKIQKSAIGELVDPSLGFESNSDVKRKITSVAELAFLCLQRDKELRPSMDEVLDVLKRIESGKDEVGHLENISPPSPDHDEVKLLRNVKLAPSPKAVTDKWDSKSTGSNVSGQSSSQI